VLGLARIADTVVCAGLMTDRLPVCADGPHLLCNQARGGEQPGHAFGIDRGQRVGRQRFAVDLVVTGMLQVQETLAQFGRKGHVRVGQHGRTFAGKVRQHAIDAVQAGAGHQADIAVSAAVAAGRGVVGMAHARQLTSAMAGQIGTSR